MEEEGKQASASLNDLTVFLPLPVAHAARSVLLKEDFVEKSLS